MVKFAEALEAVVDRLDTTVVRIMNRERQARRVETLASRPLILCPTHLQERLLQGPLRLTGARYWGVMCVDCYPEK